MPDRKQRTLWPQLRAAIAARIATRKRDDWAALFANSDACVAPVLDFDEAAHHPQALARGSYIEVDGVTQPAPAPRFSRTPAAVPGGPRYAGNDDATASLAGWLEPDEVALWRSRGLLLPIGQAP